MAKRYYGKECTQDGYLLSGHFICRNLVKRLNINYISERNYRKNKIFRKFHLYNFQNSFIKFKMMATANFNLENSNLENSNLRAVKYNQLLQYIFCRLIITKLVYFMFEGSEFHPKGGIFVILPLVKGVEWH